MEQHFFVRGIFVCICLNGDRQSRYFPLFYFIIHKSYNFKKKGGDSRGLNWCCHLPTNISYFPHKSWTSAEKKNGVSLSSAKEEEKKGS